MPFTGRYHLVREWWLPTGGLSAPFVLDRRDRALRPYRGNGPARDEWQPERDQREAVRKWQRWQERVGDEPTAKRRHRLAERLLRREADCGRVAALLDKNELFPLRLLWELAFASATTINLSSAYVINVSGNAISARHLCPVGGKTISNVYFFISSYTGTAANVADINLELRPEASTGAITPSTGVLTESKVVNPASATGWIKSTGWTSVLTALARNFFIVGDANGGVTDFAVVLYRSIFGESTIYFQSQGRFLPVATTGGFAAGNTASTSQPNLVLSFSDGSSFGNPFTAATAPASDTNRRGLRIAAAALVASLPIFGATWTASSASISGLEIYNNANVPGTSPDNTAVAADIDYASTGAASRGGSFTSGMTPYTLLAGTAYRIVATYSGVTTAGPQRNDIGTGSDANLIAAMPGGGNLYYARANGTTDWSNDLTTSFPAMGLLVDGQLAAAAAGGGMAFLGGPNIMMA